MKRLIYSVRHAVLGVIAIALLLGAAPAATAQSGVKIRAEGELQEVHGGVSPFFLQGTASHLGKFTCVGEVALEESEEGEHNGAGVAAFTAANGDVLVGVVTFSTDENGDPHMHFSWRDSIQMNDGSVIHSTGRFVDNRPPGLIVKYRVICILTFCFILIER